MTLDATSLTTLRRHAFYEGVLTFLLLFMVMTIVRWIVGPWFISRAVPSIHLGLAFVGAAVAILITALIFSPF